MIDMLNFQTVENPIKKVFRIRSKIQTVRFGTKYCLVVCGLSNVWLSNIYLHSWFATVTESIYSPSIRDGVLRSGMLLYLHLKRI